MSGAWDGWEGPWNRRVADQEQEGKERGWRPGRGGTGGRREEERREGEVKAGVFPPAGKTVDHDGK